VKQSRQCQLEYLCEAIVILVRARISLGGEPGDVVLNLGSGCSWTG